MQRLLLSLFLFAVACIAVADDTKPQVPQPRVDERVELLGIVFRLAGSPEYQSTSFKEYDNAINRHFEPFKTHPVILAAKAARAATGVSYDAVMGYAVHISIENGRVVFPDENSEKALEHLDSRWKPQTAKLFAKQLDDFYVKSRFREFFESHHEMYRKTEEKIKPINDKIDYSWFKKFYGAADLERFHVIIANTNERNNYGAKCRFKGKHYKDEHYKDGRDEYFAIIGARGPDWTYREEGYTSLVIHEFNHSFCNPHIDKHYDDLKSATERVWPFVADIMAQQAYGVPKTMWYEYLVRACEIRYFLGQGKKNEVDRRIQEHRKLGFLWIAELVELLDRYEKERDKYPTLDEFMPEIVKIQNEIVTDEFIAGLQKREDNRPKVAATNPANGAKDVDPATTEISVTFDRPMLGSMSWCGGGETYPQMSEDSRPIWSDDKRTCMITNVVLKPGKTYSIWLNNETFENFRSAENIPLKPVHYTFTTKAE